MGTGNATARYDTIRQFERVRATTDAITSRLLDEDQVAQSMPDASPTKWHRAHTTWFFEEFVLAPHDRGSQRCNDRFAYLFNSYYEVVGARHPRHERGLQTRPTCTEVGAFRAYVDAAVADLCDRTDDVTFATIAPLIELGLHHEQQHQELALMDVKHLFSRNPGADPHYRDGRQIPRDVAPPPLGWVEVAGGLVDIGHDPAHGFAFDNESPRHTVLVDRFRIANRLTTAGEYAEFIADGGYERPELWLSDGWFAAQREQWRAPLYWERSDVGWTTLTLDGRRPVLAAEPVVHISHYEADAFARWAGARLATEFEWEAAATGLPTIGNLLGDVGTDHLHPRPADVHDPGLRQMFGDAWEWTASAYLPYPRFRIAPGAVGEYNGKFMSGQMVLRGGSAATPTGHIRSTYRNFFAPHCRWMFSGIRLAGDA